MSLASPSLIGAPKALIILVTSAFQPAVQIAGWYCSAGHEVVDRTMVACLLDRLTLVNGDAKLAEMFARAEVKRTFCEQRNPILAATPEREEQYAKLKSALRGRLSHVP